MVVSVLRPAQDGLRETDQVTMHVYRRSKETGVDTVRGKKGCRGKEPFALGREGQVAVLKAGPGDCTTKRISREKHGDMHRLARGSERGPLG